MDHEAKHWSDVPWSYWCLGFLLVVTWVSQILGVNMTFTGANQI